MTEEEIRQQAYLYEQEATGAHATALQELQTQAEETRKKTRETARRVSMGTFGAYGPALEAVREEVKYEKRRGFLPGYVPELGPLRAEREALKGERRGGMLGIKAEKEDILSQIAEAEQKGETELAAQLAAQLREISEWETESVTAQRAYEAEVAAAEAKYEVEVAAAEATFEAENIQLSTGEWVPRGDYRALSAEAQAKLDKLGVAGFNIWVGEQEADLVEFKAANIEIAPNQWVPKADWNKLTPAQQKEVIETGEYTTEVEAPGEVVTESYYEVETPTGKKEISASVWEGYSDIEQLAVQMGRAPTREEYRAYSLEQELGIHPLVPSTSRLSGLQPSWLSSALVGMAEVLQRGPGSLITTPIALIQSHIPGMQFVEQYHLAEAAAIERWNKAYPGGGMSKEDWLRTGMQSSLSFLLPDIKDMQVAAFISSPLEVAGFPAVRAVYPQISAKDITKGEWFATGLNIAMITLPAWLPKAVRGVKWVGKRPWMPKSIQEFTARLGTWPFSEPPGLKRAPISTRAPGIQLAESPFTRRGYEALTEALKPKLQPWKVKPVRRGPAPGLPGRGYPTPRRIGPAEVTGKAWERIWKPSKVTPTVPTRAPAGGVTEWLKPRVQTVWEVTPAGRYIPAGTTPVYLTDIPMLVPIRTLGFPAYGVTTTPISKLTPTMGVSMFPSPIPIPTFVPSKFGQVAPIQVKQLTPQQVQQLTPAQIKQLTPQQVQQLSPAVLTTTQLQALTATQVQNLTSTQLKSLTATQVQSLTSTQLKSLTSTQVQALTSTQVQSMTATQVKNLTSTQVQSLTSTQIKSLTSTQLRNLTSTQLEAMTSTQLKSLTSTQLKTMTSTQLKIIERIKRTHKPVPKPKPPKPKAKGKSPKELDGLPLVATRQQGIVERAYYTDSKDVKARSTYNPKESGKPHDILETFGPKLGITINEDLGQVDVFMDLDKKSVRFEGDGMETDVGKRHPSPGRGMTIRRKKQPVSLRF